MEMNKLQTHRIHFKANISFVIWAIDSYTGKPPLTSSMKATVNGEPQYISQKTGGYVIFTDLHKGTYNVVLEWNFYMNCLVNITVNDDANEDYSPVTIVSLIPNFSYPFAADATLIRASIQPHVGMPISSVTVSAIARSADTVRAKLAEDVQEGSSVIKLVGIKGFLGNQQLVLVQNAPPYLEETVTIGAVSETRMYTLINKLQYTYTRGSSLFPIIRGYCDERGEIVLALPNMRAKAFEIDLIISNRKLQHVIKVIEGTTLNLGTIKLE
jgi:hypothetical protein